MILSLKPPYHLNNHILALVSEISEKLGAINTIHKAGPNPQLRRKNRVKTIQASLEIEGNSLSESQVTAILNKQRVIGPAMDILEVQNAIATYAMMDELNPSSMKDFLAAHKKLMKGLIDRPGAFRTGNVGITKGSQIAHVAPAGTMVNGLMKNLFQYVKKDDDLLLIKSCVFHYELEFIHPFSDGNGRMGRLWQTVILSSYHPIFAYAPVESLVREAQEDYYDALGKADKLGHSTPFIEFMLSVILKSLDTLLLARPLAMGSSTRISTFAEMQGRQPFCRKDYLKYYPNLSQATASRDLRQATDEGVLKKSGEKRLTTYRFAFGQE